MSSTPTTLPKSSRFSRHESSPVEASIPICPDCRITDAVKHGIYTRNLCGRAPVRVQRYQCSICGRTFSPSLSYVEDCHQYPAEVKRLGRVVNAFTGASLEALQDICTVHFVLRPSDKQLYNWTTEDTREIIFDDLPQYWASTLTTSSISASMVSPPTGSCSTMT
jgi:transposase-like protein